MPPKPFLVQRTRHFSTGIFLSSVTLIIQPPQFSRSPDHFHLPRNMSNFFLHFASASLEVDNHRGHGNPRAEERRSRRRQSREKSQRYMCRKPRRFPDQDYRVARQDASLYLSPASRIPPSRVDSPTSVVYSPDTLRSRLNARKPIRRDSIDSFSSISPTPMSLLSASVANLKTSEDSGGGSTPTVVNQQQVLTGLGPLLSDLAYRAPSLP